MAKFCVGCPKRKTCKAPCEAVEAYLADGERSIKSNYFIKFVDPGMVENMEVAAKGQNDDDTDTLELTDIIRKALAHLTPKQRKYITLHYGIKDNKYITQYKLARMFKISHHSVHINIRAGKKRIKAYIEKHHPHIQVL